MQIAEADWTALSALAYLMHCLNHLFVSFHRGSFQLFKLQVIEIYSNKKNL